MLQMGAWSACVLSIVEDEPYLGYRVDTQLDTEREGGHRG